MAVDKLVDSTQLDADLTSVANAIRAKSGGSGSLAFPSGFVSEIGNISVGDTVYYGETGCVYVKDVVIPATVTSTQNCTFYKCPNLETITALGSTQGRSNNGGYDCANLKSVHFPCATSCDGYFIRQGNSAYNKLESVTIGSIGHAVTSLANGTWRYGSHAMNLTVTIYVDATTIAGIPASVQNNANGNNAYAPTGSTVTVVYKNSTTGEVITS